MFINHTRENGNTDTPYVDNSGTNALQIRMTTANAKALGLMSGSATNSDATILFSNSFAFDFDPSNGITVGTLDFVGVATHEIGHALGFISGVDYLDTNSYSYNFFDDSYAYVSPLDLFRYSAASTPLHVIDWTAGTTGKYFSLDGGVTAGPQFSTGQVWGDGRQASHWKDNLGLGIMDPTAAKGELLSIGANDIMAFDVIGWDVTAVPEPSTYAMFGLGLAVLALVRRRKPA